MANYLEKIKQHLEYLQAERLKCKVLIDMSRLTELTDLDYVKDVATRERNLLDKSIENLYSLFPELKPVEPARTPESPLARTS